MTANAVVWMRTKPRRVSSSDSGPAGQLLPEQLEDYGTFQVLMPLEFHLCPPFKRPGVWTAEVSDSKYKYTLILPNIYLKSHLWPSPKIYDFLEFATSRLAEKTYCSISHDPVLDWKVNRWIHMGTWINLISYLTLSIFVYPLLVTLWCKSGGANYFGL